MIRRLQLIEEKLKSIDPAGFQNLCDAYLILREIKILSYSRTGSQVGKQKTISGTPDSFIRLESKRVAYVEFTTITDQIVKKIIADIDKCISTFPNYSENNDVYGIIIFFNKRLSSIEESEIQLHANNQKVSLELIGIDTLALEIMSKYFILARDYLGIPIETGQILLIDRFISEYNNKANQLSTPLDNIFFHREKELEEIISNLQHQDLLILTGAPGIGKTKLGIEGILRFCKKDPSFEAYVIINKNADIFEDLKIQLQDSKNYILLVDDANRQISNLSQVLGFFKGTKNSHIKIILTVRNYAVTDIAGSISDFDSRTMAIQKFSDEEIIEIIKSENFNILNSHYQKKIVEISDGNIRLAIMSARLANEKQTDFLWGDVSDLFDSYFNNFLRDTNIFQNRDLLKVIGILSFFFTINRADKGFVDRLLKLFDLEYYLFYELINELEEKELIEVRLNYIKVSEQVMATYFFYKVFIKDELLSFRTLLFSYFDDWKTRFKESIIPANNSFGYFNVQNKIYPILSEFLTTGSINEKRTLDFLDLFWFYMPSETLNYFYKKIELLPEPIEPVYKVKYETNDFTFNKNLTLDFISRFFSNPSDWFQQAIELSFEYARKKPEHLPELIKEIREHLIFDESDEKYDYKRQIDFVSHILSKVKQKQQPYTVAFFPISETFLQHTFQITHAERKLRIVWYNYPLSLNETIKEIRRNLWETLFSCFTPYPQDVYNVLISFKPIQQKMIPEILDYDFSFIMPFVNENFNPNNFQHAYYVQEINYWFDKDERIINRPYKQLKNRFLTPEYLDFRKLEWNRLKDKDDYDFRDFQEYDKLKTEEIKDGFIFYNYHEFERFFKAIENHLTVKKNDYFSISQSIDIVCENNFILNEKLGFDLFHNLLIRQKIDFPLLPKTLKAIVSKSKKWSSKLWTELSIWKNFNQKHWLLNYFFYLPDNHINKEICDKLIIQIQSLEKFAYLIIENYSRFEKKDTHITKKILSILKNKNEDRNNQLVFSETIFTSHLDYFEYDYELIKQSYFQQLRLNHSQVFDHRGNGFKQIFNLYQNFLPEYFETFYSDYDMSGHDTDPNISFIWDTDSHFVLIERAINSLCEKKLYSHFGDHVICNIFHHLDDIQKSNAILFLTQYIKTNHKNTSRIEMIFTAIRTCFNDKFEYLFLLFLSVNTDLQDFTAIDWAGPVGTQAGHSIFGELYAKKWEKVLDMVNKAENKLTIIPIQNYLRKRISDYYKWAESERINNFLMRDY